MKYLLLLYSFNCFAWSSVNPILQNDFNVPEKNSIFCSKQIVHWKLPFGQICDSVAQICGENITINSSLQFSTPQSTDIACSKFEGEWTYSMNNNQLTLCQSGQTCMVMK